MIKFIAGRIFIVLASLFFINTVAATSFDAAHAARVLENVDNEALPPGATLAQVEQAVLTALTSRGWQITTRADGAADAQYARRDFSVTIHVTYSATTYSIHYVESTGLDYNAQRQTIHNNFNRWINNLRVDIPRLVQNSV